MPIATEILSRLRQRVAHERNPTFLVTLLHPGVSRWVIPYIVLGEYFFGIQKSKHRKRYEAWMRDYLVFVKVGLINHQTAKTYADIRLELKKQGTPIPSNDTWIAAVARQHGLPVLSNDTHFDRVKKLKRIGF